MKPIEHDHKLMHHNSKAKITALPCQNISRLPLKRRQVLIYSDVQHSAICKLPQALKKCQGSTLIIKMTPTFMFLPHWIIAYLVCPPSVTRQTFYCPGNTILKSGNIAKWCLKKNQWQNNPKWPDVLYAQKAHQQLPNLYKNKPRVLLYPAHK